MGYNTDFYGELDYKNPITDEQLGYLKQLIKTDLMNHPEWERLNLSYYIELECDEECIRWDGSEKTYDMVEKVNLLIKVMREKYPDFELVGRLEAHGEEHDDIWALEIVDGVAVTKSLKVMIDEPVCCPHCKKSFNI